MRKIYFLVLAIVIMAVLGVLGGYYFGERSGTCIPIGYATRVVISSQHQTVPDRVIIDPERIRHLTAFANARRKCSQPTTYTMPAPQTTATFYDKERFVAAIGSGPNFFFIACPNWRGIRKAADPELKDFKRLIGDLN
jgi:hypothetical protein